jgi:hypothetical protein
MCDLQTSPRVENSLNVEELYQGETNNVKQPVEDPEWGCSTAISAFRWEKWRLRFYIIICLNFREF